MHITEQVSTRHVKPPLFNQVGKLLEAHVSPDHHMRIDRLRKGRVLELGLIIHKAAVVGG